MSLYRAALSYNAKADLVTYTEVEAERREEAVRKANGTTFGFVSGDITYSNDCAISYRKSRYQLLHSENYKTTNLSYGKRTPQYATIAVFLDLLRKKKIVVCVVHLAAGVEGELYKKQRTARTLSWYAAFRGAKARANKLKTAHNAGAVLFISDFNVDFKKRWVRALVKSVAPLYNSTWRVLNVAGGTHGPRIIDATLVKGSVGVKGSAKLLADDASSDHRPYYEILYWK